MISLNLSFYHIVSEFIELITHILNLPIIIAIAVPVLGINFYYRRKEFEIVRQRYLMDCIDILCSNTDYCLGVFRNNWAESMQLLKQFRDSGNSMTKADCSIEFVSFDYSHFVISPFYRLKKLIGNNIFWEISQSLYAFIDITNAFINRDMLRKIISSVENHENEHINYSDITDKCVNELQAYLKKSEKYYFVLEQLLEISSILEKEKFSFSTIKLFKDRDDVKNVIKKMHSHFSDEIREKNEKH